MHIHNIWILFSQNWTLWKWIIFSDLGEVGTVVSKNELKKPESQAGKDGDGKVEEEFTVARLYVSKMKSEVKNLVNKASMLETLQSEGLYIFQ